MFKIHLFNTDLRKILLSSSFILLTSDILSLLRTERNKPKKVETCVFSFKLRLGFPLLKEKQMAVLGGEEKKR